MTPQIRILIVDDHFVVRLGLREAINGEPDLVVAAEASTGAQALELYRKHAPDLVLMDARLPGMSGIEATIAIRSEFPSARIVFLSTFDAEEEIYRALQAGARSYLLKSSSRDQLLAALRAVHRGERVLDPAVATRLAERLPRPDLSNREMDVVRLVVEGKTNKEIANALCIAEVTVKVHVSHLLGKFGVSDRTQIATEAIRRGIVSFG